MGKRGSLQFYGMLIYVGFCLHIFHLYIVLQLRKYILLKNGFVTRHTDLLLLFYSLNEKQWGLYHVEADWSLSVILQSALFSNVISGSTTIPSISSGNKTGKQMQATLFTPRLAIHMTACNDLYSVGFNHQDLVVAVCWKH